MGDQVARSIGERYVGMPLALPRGMSPSNRSGRPGLLKVQLKSIGGQDAPLSAKMVVCCPRLQKDVLLQRCDFCADGRGLERDPETGEFWLRCSYLDTPPKESR